MSAPRFAFVGPTHAVSPWLMTSLAKVGTLEALSGETAERDAARFHARWTFPDLTTLLKEAEPTGVVLVQPLADRPRMVKECLSAGACVLVVGAPGKAATCNRLGLFAKLSGRSILAAPAMRFAPAMLLAKRLLDSGKVGTPISMTLRSTYRGAPRQGPDDDGAVPADQVFEAADLVHHLLGPLRHVSAVAHGDGVLAGVGTSLSSAVVSFVLHASGPTEAVGIDLEVRGADGTFLQVDRDGRLLCANGSRIDAAHRSTLASADPAIELGYDGLAAEFRRLATMGRTGAGLVGPVSAVAATAEALLVSAVKGRGVTVRTGATSPPESRIPTAASI